jgi:hypothetical protein
LFNQPDLPLSDTQSIKEKQRCIEKLPSPPPAPTPPANPAEDEANVGGKLLKLMGWKTGTGLGAAGEGRVNPIDTVVYAPGAGLGAGKPKDLDRYNDSYLSMTQDSVSIPSSSTIVQILADFCIRLETGIKKLSTSCYISTEILKNTTCYKMTIMTFLSQVLVLDNSRLD